MKFQELVAKYGLSAILMIVLGLIGIVLYFVYKDDDSKLGKSLHYAGIGIAIVGLFIGLATIGLTAMKKTTPPINGNGNGTNGAGDELPGDD